MYLCNTTVSPQLCIPILLFNFAGGCLFLRGGGDKDKFKDK